MNLLRVVAHTDWGADRKVLLHLYRTIVRSKLDYGSIVYGSARESYLGERGGSVVACRTPEREVGGSIATAAVLCP